jgi:hypothetical protein
MPSGLKISQIIDAIKRFVFPRLYDTMMGSVVNKAKLAGLDKIIRNIINDLVGSPSLSKDLF